MIAVQSRQKSNVNQRHNDFEVQVGVQLFLKVSPIRGMVRFRYRREKVSPHYIGTFEILKCIGRVAHKLALPPRISTVHNVFYMSMLTFM